MDTSRHLTLRELLVVFLIGMILVVLLYNLNIGHVTPARESARKARCSNNLRQLAFGLEIYMSDAYYKVSPAWTAQDDDGPRLVTALGRLYQEGKGLVSDSKGFSCPSNPCRPPDAFGPDINGQAAINHIDESSYSLTRRLRKDDAPDKIIVADKGDGRGHGNVNHDDGQNCLFMDTHVKFERTTNPSDDIDPSGIYERGDGGSSDTWME